jgi:hypothetical protein
VDRLRNADETGKVLEALLDGGRDVLRYLWMSYADPMVCPVEPRPWRELPMSFEDRADDGILALMIDTRRW